MSKDIYFSFVKNSKAWKRILSCNLTLFDKLLLLQALLPPQHYFTVKWLFGSQQCCCKHLHPMWISCPNDIKIGVWYIEMIFFAIQKVRWESVVLIQIVKKLYAVSGKEFQLSAPSSCRLYAICSYLESPMCSLLELWLSPQVSSWPGPAVLVLCNFSERADLRKRVVYRGPHWQ